MGYYGGINYGYGYGGVGYEGGRWEGGHFAYNTYVNHVDTTIIHNTYNTTVTMSLKIMSATTVVPAASKRVPHRSKSPTPTSTMWVR